MNVLRLSRAQLQVLSEANRRPMRPDEVSLVDAVLFGAVFGHLGLTVLYLRYARLGDVMEGLSPAESERVVPLCVLVPEGDRWRLAAAVIASVPESGGGAAAEDRLGPLLRAAKVSYLRVPDPLVRSGGLRTTAFRSTLTAAVFGSSSLYSPSNQKAIEGDSL